MFQEEMKNRSIFSDNRSLLAQMIADKGYRYVMAREERSETGYVWNDRLSFIEWQ